MAEYIEKWSVVNRLIDLENEFQQYKPFHGFEHAMYRKVCEAEISIGKTQAADVVPKSLYDQTAWERDLAIKQLREDYGVELGEKKKDVAPVQHGRWLLQANNERTNYRWNVTAECLECCDEKKEIWAGFFPNVPDWLARDVALESAKSVKLSNYCPNCGAKMDLER